MSAIPRSRSATDRAAPRRLPVLDAPADAADFYGLIPARPFARTDLSDRAKVVLSGLAILARGSRTWVRATVEEVAVAAGHSARKARQGLAELSEARVIEWESIGSRFRVLFRLRGQAEGDTPPAPRIGPAPDCAPVSVPVCVAAPAPHTPVLVLRERQEKNDDERAESSSSEIQEEIGEGVVHEPNYNPNAPLNECLDQPTEDELHDAIGQRIVDLWGAVNRSMLRADIRDHGEAAVEYALTVCEEMPTPPRGQSYIGGILRKQREEGTELGRRKTRSERHARSYYRAGDGDEAPAPMQRGDLAESIELARSADPHIANFARSVLRGAVATGQIAADQLPSDIFDPTLTPKKTPAAGSHGNVPPPPVRELADLSAHTESYREQEFTASDTGGDGPQTHPAPGGTIPAQAPTAGASRTETQSAGPRGGGRDGTAGLSPAVSGRVPSLAPPIGAHRGPDAGPPAGAAARGNLPVPAVESDQLGAGRQRLSDDAPRPVRRE